MTTEYLSFAEVLQLHQSVITATGGSFGVRSESLVESAITRPMAGYGDFEAYSGVFLKAAVLMEGLIKNHGFVDGNKRTAVVVTIIFLKRNKYSLKVEQKQLVEFAVKIAKDKLDFEEIAKWLEENSKAN